MDESIEINRMKWSPVPGVSYRYNILKHVKKISDAPLKHEDPFKERGAVERNVWRNFVLQDLWFLVYFGMQVPIANCKWWVQACREVQDGPKNGTLDLWARGHGKSTIITAGYVIQQILNNPEERICIFSWKNQVALSFFRQIKHIFESSQFLKYLFPDVLYADPFREAPKWSEDAGIYVKRRGLYKEPTVMASGLIEGLPTGFHFTGRVYDDIMTAELARSPDMMQVVKDAFDMSKNLGTGTADDWEKVIGTPYNYDDLLMKLEGLKDDNNLPIYVTRRKPATIDGTPNGPSAYLPEEQLAKLRLNKQTFYSQQLLDPTPLTAQKLDVRNLKEIEPKDIPQRLFKFMTIDPAGERKDRTGDSWAIAVIGVEPFMDDLGASNIYILDLIVEPMSHSDALDQVVSAYLRAGRVLKLGVEKVAQSTAEMHVSAALRARGRNLSVENGGITIVRPAGRSKAERIEGNLMWPLQNGKIHISKAIPVGYRERLKTEMQKFPFFHDDALDALSYVYDLLKDYRFSKKDLSEASEKRDPFTRRRNGENGAIGWLKA